MAGDGARRVWSSEGGRTCPACGEAVEACRCPREAGPAARRPTSGSGRKASGSGGGPVRVGRETKGRRGKGVTVVANLPLGGAALEALAQELKRLCGSGGTVRDGVVEIQGEHRDRVVAALEAKGYTVRRAGG